MSSILETLRLHRPEAGKKTLQIYASQIKKYGDNVPMTPEEFVERTTTSIHGRPLAKESINTRLSGVIAYHGKKYIDKYNSENETNWATLRQQLKKEIRASHQKLTKSQQERWCDWKTIVAGIKILKEAYRANPNLMNTRNYLIALLYSSKEMRTRRGMDFYAMKVMIKTEPDMTIGGNYAVIKSNRTEKGSYFIFGNYKNVKAYGLQKYPMNRETWRVLKKWIKFNHTDSFLFPIINQRSQPQVAFTRAFQDCWMKAVGKPINIGTMRKISDTTFVKPAMKKLKQELSKANHSYDTSMKHYVVFD
jgi:hypothetical protein